MNTASDARRQRLIYRASHRGTKEMDLILGSYVRAQVWSLSDDHLSELERIIDVQDHELYSWISGTENVPAEYDTAVLRAIKDHCNSGQGLVSPNGQPIGGI